MSFYSPLFYFDADVDSFRFNRYVEICKEKYSDIDKKDFLSRLEVKDVENCKFWIKISDSFPKYLKPSFICNTILLSLWVKKPNQIETRFRFGDDNSISRQLDRFQFIKVDHNDNKFSKGELTCVKIYYKSFCKILRKNGRLYIAQLNTFRGCQAHNWAVGFLLFTAAFEAILTYERGFGITKRLSKTHACLMVGSKKKRDQLFKKFIGLYNIRSDIMHGNQRKYQRANGNIRTLSELTTLLRNLWHKILFEKDLHIILEADDNIRKAFFKKLQAGYSVPKI